MPEQQSMKAVVAKKGQLEVASVPKCSPSSNQLLIKLEVTGVCHTDLHVAAGDFPSPKQKKQCILGHEGVGRVDFVGQDVSDDFKIGDRVVVPWLGVTCGQCEHCLCGRQNLCPDKCVLGTDMDGTYAEYVCVNPRAVLKLPPSLAPSQAAPLACAGLTTFKALKDSGLRANQWVAVIGAAGGLGHLAVQYAKAMVFKVIAIDLGQEKMNFLKQLGVDHVIVASKGNVLQQVQALSPLGVHAALVLAPQAKAYQQAIEITAAGGVIMAVAGPKEGVFLDMHSLIWKGIQLKGSIVGNMQDLREALAFAEQGQVKAIVTEYPLEEAVKVHAKLKKYDVQGRAVLTCCKGKVATESKVEGLCA